MEIQHFSHEHSLVLYLNNSDHGKIVTCNGCGLPIFRVPSYNCVPCTFFLHKSCAELQTKIEHHMHPQHHLTLVSELLVRGEYKKCNSCDQNCYDFSYHCSECLFSLCLKCLFAEEFKNKQTCHEHPLSFIRKLVMLHCDACGKKHEEEGRAFLCSDCNFGIHEECALLPSKIENNIHHTHPLILIFSFPQWSSKYEVRCRVCGKGQRLGKHDWIYCCTSCKYYVHIKCAFLKPRSKSIYLKLLELLIELLTVCYTPILALCFQVAGEGRTLKSSFPVASASVASLVSNLVKQLPSWRRTNETSIKTKKALRVLQHFSHEHPLVLSKDHHHVPPAMSSCYWQQHLGHSDIVCNCCILPISPPFYSCHRCGFFLHRSCSELSNGMPSDRRYDTLVARTNHFLGLFRCFYCAYECNGFAFQSHDGERYIDVRCAFLPSNVIHEALPIEYLSRREVLSVDMEFGDQCNCCLQEIHSCMTMSAHVTLTKCYILHIWCGLLPGRVSHKYDRHVLILNYSPVDNFPDEYYCEFCEDEMNPNAWFYHCGDCMTFYHPQCIPLVDPFAKIKFGNQIRVTCHPHLLTFLRLLQKGSKCDYCNMTIPWEKSTITQEDYVGAKVFECLECDYKLCWDCAKEVTQGEAEDEKKEYVDDELHDHVDGDIDSDKDQQYTDYEDYEEEEEEEDAEKRDKKVIKKVPIFYVDDDDDDYADSLWAC